MLVIDFLNDKIGLHVNGKAHIRTTARQGCTFVHCPKNIPLLRKLTEDEGSVRHAA